MTALLETVLAALAAHSGPCAGHGVSEAAIARAEAALGFRFPAEYAAYLRRLNYAELHGDPVFGIHEDPGLSWCDVVRQNSAPQDAVPGHLGFFSSDLDGTCYIRLASGEVFRPDLAAPAWNSFAEFLTAMIGS